MLVDAAGRVRAEDRNRVASGDSTRHPEFELARWAANNMTLEERAAATVYTSGEHCPMCSAAHGWVGLGRIVYATSSEQLAGWLREWGVPPAPVCALRIQDIVPARSSKVRFRSLRRKCTSCIAAFTRRAFNHDEDVPRYAELVVEGGGHPCCVG